MSRYPSYTRGLSGPHPVVKTDSLTTYALRSLKYRTKLLSNQKDGKIRRGRKMKMKKTIVRSRHKEKQKTVISQECLIHTGMYSRPLPLQLPRKSDADSKVNNRPSCLKTNIHTRSAPSSFHGHVWIPNINRITRSKCCETDRVSQRTCF